MAVKTVWVPMPPSQRAKQFAPFQALKGLNEAIAKKEKTITPRRELADDAIAELNHQLVSLSTGSIITVVYYCDYAQDYKQLTGCVKSIDPLWKVLEIGGVSIDFRDITEICPHNN